MQTRIDLENGKYTLVHTDGANFHALRNGSPWRDLGGDGLVLAAAQEIEALRSALQRVIGLAECLQESLTNASEDFDDPYSGEEKDEDDRVLDSARAVLK